MKTDQYIQTLYLKFLSGKIDAKELQELFDCLENKEQQDQLRLLIRQTIATEPETENDKKIEQLVFDVKSKLRKQLRPAPKRKIQWQIYAAAAVALIAIGLAYFLIRNRTLYEDPQEKQTAYAEDIQPGGNKAILTLSSGKKVQLDDKNSAVYGESGIEIKQEKDGTITYQLINIAASQTTGTNMIEVPKGGQYKVILPDGTRVWLNSASTLRYPVAFGTTSRTMEMTGEAFFAIAPNKNFPFKVMVGGQEVTALGTSFNINAYSNEPNVTTTLIEGKLKVQDQTANKTVIIYPGQQTNARNGTLLVSKVNTVDVMAWKDGLFVINKASLQAVLRQIERWYDVEVDVRLPADAGTFSGELPKNTTIAEMLQSLETVTGVKLKLEGRRITNR